MSESQEFTVGMAVACTDGPCGGLQRLLLDESRALTHLVVAPSHRRGAGRLVPIDLVASVGTELRLSCTLADFSVLERSEVTEALPERSVDWGYVQQQMGAPYGGGGPIFDTYTPPTGQPTVTRDVVPPGEREVGAGDRVHATDGTIGRLHGLVANAGEEHRVTHLVLDEGHLFEHKRIAIPIGAVGAVSDGIQLTLTKDQVKALPPLDLGLHE